MIFLTIGTQLPFDRLSRALDLWAASRPDANIFGQIAEPGVNGYEPRHYAWKASIAPTEYDAMVDQAALIVAHAGMGSILTALKVGRPIVIMPRRAANGEHRSDHQMATAERFKDLQGVYVAWDETELAPMIDKVLEQEIDGKVDRISDFAEPSLIEAVRDQIIRA